MARTEWNIGLDRIPAAEAAIRNGNRDRERCEIGDRGETGTMTDHRIG